MDYRYYKVISSCESSEGISSIYNAVKEVALKVRIEMQKGRKPIGGICIEGNSKAAFQAMIKED